MIELATSVGNKDTLCRTAPTERPTIGTKTKVKGRLNKHFEFWKYNLKASHFVLNIVKDGHDLPFSHYPPPLYAKNNTSSLCNKHFVDNAVAKLLEEGMIEEIDSRPYICIPLTVAEGKKLRLVLDLRHVNQYLMRIYEDLKTIAQKC